MATKKLSTVLLLLVIATIAVVDVEPKKRHHHRQHKTKLEFLNGERKQNVLLAPVPDIGYFKFPTDQEPSPLNQQVHQAAMVRLQFYYILILYFLFDITGNIISTSYGSR